METELKKTIWKEAATGGLYLGLVLVASTVAKYLFQDINISTLTGLVEFMAVIGFTYAFARKISELYRPDGFTIMQSMGFIVKMMLFAGVITGLGLSIMNNVVDPQYYYDIMEEAMLNSGLTDAQIELMSERMAMVRNPLVMIFSGVMYMLLYGGLIGLVVSVFVKRPPEQYTINKPE